MTTHTYACLPIHVILCVHVLSALRGQKGVKQQQLVVDYLHLGYMTYISFERKIRKVREVKQGSYISNKTPINQIAAK